MQAIPTDILNESPVYFTTTKKGLFSIAREGEKQVQLRDWIDNEDLAADNFGCFKLDDAAWKEYEKNLKNGKSGGQKPPLTKPLNAFIKGGYAGILRDGSWTVLGKIVDVFVEQPVSPELVLAIHFFKPTGRAFPLPEFGEITTDTSSFKVEHFANGVMINSVLFERICSVLDHVIQRDEDGKELTVLHVSLGFLVKGKPFAALRESGVSIFPGFVENVKATTQAELHPQATDLNYLLDEVTQEEISAENNPALEDSPPQKQ